ncbi:MAG: MarR family winged helix-turn-helix transcriptional regulator [Devosia sp.]
MADDVPSIAEYRAIATKLRDDHEYGHILYLIHELSRLVSTTFDQSMARHKLTHGQWWAIMHLFENEGVSQTDFAAILQMGRASAGKLLERMEAKGWIERRPDPHDSRIRRVYLADGVVPVFRLMGVEGQKLFHQMLGNLGPERERQLVEALGIIRANADADSSRKSPPA